MDELDEGPLSLPSSELLDCAAAAAIVDAEGAQHEPDPADPERIRVREQGVEWVSIRRTAAAIMIGLGWPSV